MSQHDRNDRTQPRQKKQDKRIATTVLLAAASLLGTTLGVKATPQEEPAAPVQGPAGPNAGPADPKTLVAIYLKTTAPTTPHVTQKVISTNQGKIKSPTSNQLKYQSNQIKGTTSNQLKLETNQGKF